MWALPTLSQRMGKDGAPKKSRSLGRHGELVTKKRLNGTAERGCGRIQLQILRLGRAPF